MQERILKKEDKLVYWAGILNPKKGSLVLTNNRLYFTVDNKELFSILLSNVLSVNCQKGIGTSNENMFVIYKDGDKEKKVKIQHSSLMSLATVGNLSRISASYFSSWEQAINSARSGNQDNEKGSIDDLERLSELKKKGILTEEEFSAKKKQILGI
ncbi:MAG: hypothetical protein RLZZ347_204 [Candidatus Parcubacteria bacterium]